MKMKPPQLTNSVATCAAMFLVFTIAQTASAQVYVGNLSYLDTSGSPSSRIPFGRDINNVIPRIAQGFQTGPNLNGYLLDTVTLAFDNSIGNPSGFSLNLFTMASSGQPSASLGRLMGNSDPDQRGNYTYSALGLVLQPNTEYFLVVQGNGTGYGNNQYLWYRASTFIADSNDGWGIDGISYSLNGGAWTFWGGYAPAAFQINAVVVPEPSIMALLFASIAVAAAGKFPRHLGVK